MKVNVFKVVVLLGIFVLVLVFVGNDFVNFIGVFLVGYFLFIDYIVNGIFVGLDGFLMIFLMGLVKILWYFLIGVGVVMVYVLCIFKKVYVVIKILVDFFC